MTYPFYKYQGTGNDFILIDNRLSVFSKNATPLIAAMCHRRFGIGADGFILINADETVDFAMDYYNSDGQLSSMCGNGGRCAVAFAHELGMVGTKVQFRAVDGLHEAYRETDTSEGALVTLKMNAGDHMIQEPDFYFLNTGSPHHIVWVKDVEAVDVEQEGKAIRNSERYAPNGTNVNFVEQTGPNRFKIRTYERGVEAETWSCGTGATAVALAAYAKGDTDATQIEIAVRGGMLRVDFKAINQAKNQFQEVFLTGPAKKVFQGFYPEK